MNEKESIAVIGAGISGLSIGYWLQKAGYRVRVFEKSAVVGGCIHTEEEDGFLIDYGPNSTLETSEVLKELVSELGLEEEKVYGNEASNKRYIVKNGTLMQVPMSPGSFLKTKLFSFSAKLRLLKEPFIKKTKGDDISLGDFVKYRLGQEFLDYAINPFVAGVYAGDPGTLSTAAGFPKLYALEQNYGSFIVGAIKGARERKKRKEVAKDRAKLFSFRGGMQVFIDALTERLNSRIQVGTEIDGIAKQENGFAVTWKSNGKTGQDTFDKVVLAVPSDSLVHILKGQDISALETIEKIPYPPVAVVFTGFRESDIKRDLDGFGFLIPAVEKRQILGSIWSSTIFPNRAPEGHVAFTSFVGGTRQPENAGLDEKQLEEVVLKELDELVGLKGKPVKTKIRKWPRAIPQYTVGYKNTQALFDKYEENMQGMYIAGNIRRGISVGDSVLCAHETVQKIINNHR